MSTSAHRPGGRAGAPIADDPTVLPHGATVDGRTLERPVAVDCDVVVIGSGASGATVAVRLAERGLDVVILEEGPWVRTAEMTDRVAPAMKRLFRSGGTTAMHGRAVMPFLQGRCVGGSTTVNSAMAWRPPPAVIASWRTEHGLGDALRTEDLEPHWERLERELSVRPVDDAVLGGNAAAFARGAEILGLGAEPTRRYDGGCAGSASCLTGCPTGRKLSMNVTFVPRALHAGARLFTSTRVDRIVVEAGRATGVLGHAIDAGGRRVAVRVGARRGVIVAASTVQTPGLLRRAGVRSRHLGAHFQCHPAVSMVGRFDRSIAQHRGATQGMTSTSLLASDRLKLETVALPPEVLVTRIPGVGGDLAARLADRDRMATFAVIVRAEAEGTVGSLLDRQRVRFTPSAVDMVRARRGLSILARMLFAAGAREVYPGVAGVPEVLDHSTGTGPLDDAPLDPRAYNMMSSHLFGAARMAPDASRGVVDPGFQVFGVRGLFVVDSSVFPTNLGVNPQHTIMAMASLAAERIAA